MTTTHTIHRTPEGYRYGETVHAALWDATTAVVDALCADLIPSERDHTTRWLYGALSARQARAWLCGVKVEVTAP